MKFLSSHQVDIQAQYEEVDQLYSPELGHIHVRLEDNKKVSVVMSIECFASLA